MPASGIFSDVQGQEPRSFDFCPGPVAQAAGEANQEHRGIHGVFWGKEFG